MGCMDNMAISSGLKCCFDKLAHIQDSCLPNQGHLNSAARHYCCYFVGTLIQNLGENFASPSSISNCEFQFLLLKCRIFLIISLRACSHHPPLTVTVAVRVHSFSPPPFLSVPSSSFALLSPLPPRSALWQPLKKSMTLMQDFLNMVSHPRPFSLSDWKFGIFIISGHQLMVFAEQNQFSACFSVMALTAWHCQRLCLEWWRDGSNLG